MEPLFKHQTPASSLQYNTPHAKLRLPSNYKNDLLSHPPPIVSFEEAENDVNVERFSPSDSTGLTGKNVQNGVYSQHLHNNSLNTNYLLGNGRRNHELDDNIFGKNSYRKGLRDSLIKRLVLVKKSFSAKTRDLERRINKLENENFHLHCITSKLQTDFNALHEANEYKEAAPPQPEPIITVHSPIEPQLYYRSETTAGYSDPELSPAVRKTSTVQSECTAPSNVNTAIQSNSKNTLIACPAWSYLDEDAWPCTPPSTPSTSFSYSPFLATNVNNSNQQDDCANFASSTTSHISARPHIQVVIESQPTVENTMVSEVTTSCHSYSPSYVPCTIGEDIMRTSETEGPLSPTYELQRQPISRSRQELFADGKYLNGVATRNTFPKLAATSIALSPSEYANIYIKPSIESTANVAAVRKPEVLTQNKLLTLNSLRSKAKSDHSVVRKTFIPVQKAGDYETLFSRKPPHKDVLNKKYKSCFVQLSSPNENTSVGELPEKEQYEPLLKLLPHNQFVREDVCGAQERGTETDTQREISLHSPVVVSMRSSPEATDSGELLDHSSQRSNDPLVLIISNSTLRETVQGLPSACSGNSPLRNPSARHSNLSAHKTVREAKPTTGLVVNRNSSLYTLPTAQSRHDLQSSHRATGETETKTRIPVDRNSVPNTISTPFEYPILYQKATESGSGYPVTGSSDNASPFNGVATTAPCGASSETSLTSEHQELPQCHTTLFTTVTETNKSCPSRSTVSERKNWTKRYYPVRTPAPNSTIYKLVAQLNDAVSKHSKVPNKTPNNHPTSANVPTVSNTETLTTSRTYSNSATTTGSRVETAGYTGKGVVTTKHGAAKILTSYGSPTHYSGKNPKISGTKAVQQAAETDETVSTLTSVVHLNETANRSLSRNDQNQPLPEYSTIVCTLDEPEVKPNRQRIVPEIEASEDITIPRAAAPNVRSPSMSDQNTTFKQTGITGIHSVAGQTSQATLLQSRETGVVPTYYKRLESKVSYAETVSTTVTATETNVNKGGVSTVGTVETIFFQPDEMTLDPMSKKLDMKSHCYSPSASCSEKIEYEAKQVPASYSPMASVVASLVVSTPPSACSSRDTARMENKVANAKDTDKTLNIQTPLTTYAAKTNRTGQSEETPSNNHVEKSSYPIITVHYKPERLPPLIVNDNEVQKKLSLRNKKLMRKRMQNCKLPRYLMKTLRKHAPIFSGNEGPSAEKQIRLATPTADDSRQYPVIHAAQQLSNERNSSTAKDTQNTCNKHLPKPIIFAIPKENGATLKWSIEQLGEMTGIESYELFSYRNAGEGSSVPSIDMLWNKIGVFQARQLSMLCTVTDLRRQSGYHFMVRVVDCNDRAGPFSQYCTVLTS